ncbi:MAG: hypothetical protein AAFS03_06550, partial [Pseudomonadota bacterium]
MYDFTELGSAITRFKQFSNSLGDHEANPISVFLSLSHLSPHLKRLAEISEVLPITQNPLQKLIEQIEAEMSQCYVAPDTGEDRPSKFREKMYVYGTRSISTALENFE